MIGRSIPELIFIRLCILGLRSIAPLSIGYLIGCAIERRNILPVWVTAYAALEAAFFGGVYLPRRWMMQKPAQHPEILPPKERQALFHKCITEISMAESYLGWFHSPSSDAISRTLVREWILWALFSCHPEDAEGRGWDEEIEGYIGKLEGIVGRRFEDLEGESESKGAKGARSWRPTLDPVQMVHRPFVWYMIVGVVDFLTSISLSHMGFKHYNSMPFFSAFPPRPLLTFLSSPSPVPEISYWYRPHKSTTKHPIVFIHGIGIGLWPYTPFFRDIIAQDPDVGIILIEILPISMHIASPPLSRPAMVSAIHTILTSIPLPNPQKQQFILSSHSYGTILSTHLLHHPPTSLLISSTLLIDPIPFLIHMPDVAFNFMYRQPRTANEWQLWYFASRDPDVSRALGRYFFWVENVMWRGDLLGSPRPVSSPCGSPSSTGGEGEERDERKKRKFAVVLSGCDQIVSHSALVRRYLTGEDQPREYWRSDSEGGELEVIWKEGLDHATVFDTGERRRCMLDVLGRFNADVGEGENGWGERNGNGGEGEVLVDV